MFDRKKILIIITIIVLILVGIGLTVNTVIMKKNNVKITVAPREAEIKLGDQTLTSGKDTYIEKGEYELFITANDFIPVKEKVTVDENLKELMYCLTPVKISLEKFVADNPEYQFICEGAAGQAYNQEVSAAVSKYPVLAHLPYEDGTFSVGQGIDKTKLPNEPTLVIHYSTEQSKKDADTWLNKQPGNKPTFIYKNDYEQTDQIGGEGSQIDTVLREKYPIVSALPIDSISYKLGYRIDQSDPSGRSIKLTIIADTPMGRLGALREIRNLGYNPIDFKIEFIDFKSEVK